jgi:hypothetical protein
VQTIPNLQSECSSSKIHKQYKYQVCVTSFLHVHSLSLLTYAPNIHSPKYPGHLHNTSPSLSIIFLLPSTLPSQLSYIILYISKHLEMGLNMFLVHSGLFSNCLTHPCSIQSSYEPSQSNPLLLTCSNSISLIQSNPPSC